MSAARWAGWLGAPLIFVVGCWAFSWLSAAWLSTPPGEPQWSFSSNRDIIAAATRGIEARFVGGDLELVPDQSDAYVMLRLPRAVDTDRDRRLVLDLCTDAPLELGLGTGSEVFTIVPVSTGCGPIEAPLNNASSRVFPGLRLHLFGALGQPVTLRHARLQGEPKGLERLDLSGPPGSESALAEQLETLARQPVDAVLHPEPPWLRLAPVLAWRDAVRGVRPHAWLSIGADLPRPGAIGARVLIGATWLFACGLILTVLYRSGPREATTRRSGLLIAAVLVLAGGPLLAPESPWITGFGVTATLVLVLLLRVAAVKEAISTPGRITHWLAAIGLILAAWALLAPDLRLEARDIGRYLAWAVFQQLLLGPIFSRELRSLVGGGVLPAAMAAGGLFGALHLPNLELALLTGALGSLWSSWYLRGHSLWPQVVAHAGLGCLAMGVPQSLLYSLEAGLRFLQ